MLTNYTIQYSFTIVLTVLVDTYTVNFLIKKYINAR
jgi:hypothetical protein